MKLWLKSLKHTLFGKNRKTPRGATKTPSMKGRRLGVESLEDRLAPANVVTDLNTISTYPTIQAAVDAANPGDTIVASAGVYSEKVTVDKSLTIEGAQHGVDARTRSGASESILDAAGNGGQTLFYVMASDVTIDGFTVQNETSDNGLGFAIDLSPGTSGSRILNNIIQNNVAGIALANNSSVDSTVIQDNLFQNNNYESDSSALDTDIYSDQYTAGGVLQNVLIDSNTFTNSTPVDNSWAFGISNTSSTPFTNLTFSNNIVTNHGRGVYLYNTIDSAITGNTIDPATTGHYAVGLFNGDSGISITRNLITSGSNDAVEITDDFATPNSTVTVSDNSLLNVASPSYAISVAAGSYTGTLNASGNWWDTALGATPTNSTTDLGLIEGLVSAPASIVHVGSFLDSGANTAAAGFTPAASTEMWVPQTAATTGNALIDGNIQDGVNTAVSGMTVRVAADTYSQLVVVAAPVKLLGAEAGVDARTRSSVPESIVTNSTGDFQIEADNVTINGFTLEGVTSDPGSNPASLGAAIWTNPGFSGTHGGLQALNNIITGNIAGIELDNDGVYLTKVQDNLFKDNTQPAAGSGLDVETDFGLTNALIDSNTFTNTSFVAASWALGVGAPGANITFSNNAVTNQGRGVYFYETTGAMITGNSVTGASHYAIGIFGLNGSPANSSFTISNNTLNMAGSGGAGVELQDDTTPGFAYTGTLTVSGDHYTTSGSDVSLRNESATPINATGETFNSILASSATLAQQFVIVDTIVDGVDVAGFGLVRTKAANVYVTPNSFFSPDGTTTPSIQRGIDAASSGDTVNVEAGSYVANGNFIDSADGVTSELNINKALTLLGPNPTFNPISSTTPANAQAIILPGASDPNPFDSTAISIIGVNANNVTIEGFTINGDNPALASDPHTITYNSVPIDASEGISSYVDAGNITIQGNIVENTAYTGVDFENAFNDPNSNNAVATSNNLITQNYINNLGGGGFDFGVGVVIYNNFYAEVTDNVINTVRVGVQTGNFSQANPGGAGTASISDNQISAVRRGIYYNLHYSSASPFTIASNTIKAVEDGTVTKWDGIMISSQAGAVSATFQGNTIDGGADVSDASQTVSGYDVWNTPTTGTLLISGGSATGVDYGVWVNTYEGNSGPADSTQVTVSGTGITAKQIGVYVEDSYQFFSAQFMASSAPEAPVSATIEGGASISGGPTGVLVDGSLASALVQQADVTSNTTGVSVTNGGNLTGVSQSFITGNTTGIDVASSAGTIGMIFDNDLAGNTSLAVNNQSSTLVNATSNTWGSSVVATIASEVGGSVEYLPFLTSSAATAPPPGFQGDYSMLSTNEGAPFTGVTLAFFTVAGTSAQVSDFTPSITSWGGATLTGSSSVTVQLVSRTDTSSTFEVLLSATFAEAGSFTVSAKVENGVSAVVSTSSTTFTVGDLPLTDTTTAQGTKNGTEGAAFSNVVLATFSDGNTSASASDFTAVVSYTNSPTFDGTPSYSVQPVNVTGGVSNWEVVANSVTFAEKGDYTASVKITDAGGGKVGPTANGPTFSVADAPLMDTTTAQGAKNGTEGNAFSNVVLATFSDGNPSASASDFTPVVSYTNSPTFDGTPSYSVQPVNVTGGVSNWEVVANSATFAEKGAYTASVKITDVGGSKVGPTANGPTFSVADAALTDTTTAQGTKNGSVGVPFSNVVLATFSDGNPYATAADFTPTVSYTGAPTFSGTPSYKVTSLGVSDGVSKWEVVAASATFHATGNFTASVTINDVDGGKVGPTANGPTFTIGTGTTSTTNVTANSLTFSTKAQLLNLSAHVSSPAGAGLNSIVNEGVVTFTISDSHGHVVGTAKGYVLEGVARTTFEIPASLARGTYTVTASYSDVVAGTPLKPVFQSSSNTGSFTIS